MSAPVIEPVLDQHHGLWSLWEMMDKHAYLFMGTATALTEFRCLCSQFSQSPTPDAPDNVLEIAKYQIPFLRHAYILSGMQDKMGPLDRLEQAVNSPLGCPLRNASTLAEQIRHFLLGLRDLLQNEFYFHLDGKDVAFFNADEPFGESVTH
jgi:hypothetical protein